jgi:very-short-patch-repair endonuclease
MKRRSEFKQAFAKRLREEATDSERILWARLRNRQLSGLRFRRQQPIGPFVVDFYCPAAKLIVELDGSQHGADGNRAYDERRTRYMNARGFHVLRFNNYELLQNYEAVLESIARAVASDGHPSPNALRAFDPPSGGGSTSSEG